MNSFDMRSLNEEITRANEAFDMLSRTGSLGLPDREILDSIAQVDQKTLNALEEASRIAKNLPFKF